MILLVLLATTFTTLHAQVGEMKFPEGSVQHVVLAGEMPWMPCPPNLPSGCEIAVLEGSPKSSDLFTVRFRMNTAIVMQPHTHPKDERVTILQGKAAVAFGKDARREDAREFVQKLWDQMELFGYEMDPTGIRVIGSTAIVHYYLIWKDKDGCQTGSRYRLTHTWIKQNGQWLVAGGMSSTTTD